MENDLISRSALLAKRCKLTGIVDDAGLKHGAIAIPVDIIKNAPAIDAVQVIRCEDCKNWDKENSVGGKEWGNLMAPCSWWSNHAIGYTRGTPWNGFCHHGKRREDDAAD